MYYFCTYFDRNYLSRGLALYRSLREHCPEFKLWALCMDEAAHEALVQLNLPGIQPIALRDFEEGDHSLLAAKKNRSRIEYYFTCSPSLPLYVLKHWPEVDLITYVDADLFLFANPAPLFDELGSRSIAIIGHRFSPYMRKDEIYGIYNVGWLSFRHDEDGLACLNWWREKCNEWCFARLEDGRYADQKYLDDWPKRFRNVAVLEHKGANAALWNIGNYRLHCRDTRTVMLDEDPLIVFHFHGLKRLNSWLYNPGWTGHGVAPSRVLRRRVYNPYIQCLDDASRQLASVSGIHSDAPGLRIAMKPKASQVSPLRRMMRKLLAMSFVGKDLLTGKYIVCARFYGK